MLINEFIISIIILTIIIHTFYIGYFVGSKLHENHVSQSIVPNSVTRPNNTKNRVFIDDTKFVTEIKTDTLEKKYDSLGDVKSTSENISDSVNKLKNLKG